MTRIQKECFQGRISPQEVKHDGVDDPVGHGVLLVEEDPQEDGVGAAVLHLGDLQHHR